MKNIAIYRTIVYVDGQLLARRLAAASSELAPRWFDLTAFATPLLPFDHDLVGIRYYANDIPGRNRHTYFEAQQHAVVRLPQLWENPPDLCLGRCERALAGHLLHDGAA